MNLSPQSPSAYSVSSVNNRTQITINELIATNNDRYESFTNSVREVNDTHLKDLFTRLSLQSQRFNEELKSLVPFVNDDTQSTLREDLFRAGVFVRPAVIKNDRCRVLSACEFGEIMAVSNYTLALKELGLHEKVRRTIQEQLIHLTNAMKSLQSLNANANSI